jgi:uncharacterized membrane protein
VHLSTVLAMPRTAKQDAYSRLAPLAPVNVLTPLAAPTAADAVMPFMDPAFAVAVCRYDLTAGTLKFTAPVSQAYTSVTFYTRNSMAYYAINDHAAADRLIIDSPSATGLIVLRALAPEMGMLPTAQATLAQAQCRVAPLTQ